MSASAFLWSFPEDYDPIVEGNPPISGMSAYRNKFFARAFPRVLHPQNSKKKFSTPSNHRFFSWGFESRGRVGHLESKNRPRLSWHLGNTWYGLDVTLVFQCFLNRFYDGTWWPQGRQGIEKRVKLVVALFSFSFWWFRNPAHHLFWKPWK